MLARLFIFYVYSCIFLPSLTGFPTSLRSHANDYEATSVVPLTEHIEEMGYPVESHEIQTEDGYLLTYHRIPGGTVRDVNSTKHPVILQHGLMCDSSIWAEVKDSLGFVLADAGYDVWLANSRGNEFSRNHTCYDPDKDKKLFWDFSWHEMGYYDLPAAIDYILNHTGRDQLSYIGHSMGTSMFFVLGATRHEYMAKVKSAFMLAPVAYIQDMPSPTFNFFHDFTTPLDILAKLSGYYEVLRYGDIWHRLIHFFCKEGRPTQTLCLDFIFSLTGYDSAETNKTLLPNTLDYLPAGTSLKTLVHFSQIVNSDFREYNYGLFDNLKHYKKMTPPSYNLSLVDAPLYLYAAPNDWIVTPDVVMRTAEKLGNLQALNLVQYTSFNHVDFMWAQDVKALVYDDIVDILHKLTNTNK